MAFSFSSAINNLVNGLTNNASDVVTCFNDVKAVLNNGITGTDHLSASAGIVGTQLASSTVAPDRLSKGIVQAGKANISTSESRTNTAYGTLTTPDQVTNVTLPTDGLIFVAYQATWQQSVADAARATIFIGGNQQKAASVGGAPATVEAGTGSGPTASDMVLASWQHGLCTPATTGAYGGDVTTGQSIGLLGGGAAAVSPVTYVGGVFNILMKAPTPNELVWGGGPCVMFAAAGTYTVSVQYRAISGTVTAKNRRLWVWTIGF